MTQLTLIGRDGCHLCEDARGIVTDVLEQFPDVQLVEASIDTDAELRRAWADEIPVLLINGRMHAYWRVDAQRLRAALTAAG